MFQKPGQLRREPKKKSLLPQPSGAPRKTAGPPRKKQTKMRSGLKASCGGRQTFDQERKKEHKPERGLTPEGSG